MNLITVETTVKASISTVWEYWNKPEHIKKWAFASKDWETPYAENDLRVGGKFKTTMAAKDGSESFDVVGSYTNIKEKNFIEYDLEDGRHVSVRFEESSDGVKITETFEPFPDYTQEQERSGWQAILDNFKKYTESNS